MHSDATAHEINEVEATIGCKYNELVIDEIGLDWVGWDGIGLARTVAEFQEQ